MGRSKVCGQWEPPLGCAALVSLSFCANAPLTESAKAKGSALPGCGVSWMGKRGRPMKTSQCRRSAVLLCCYYRFYSLFFSR
jgi:hypothetical protein